MQHHTTYYMYHNKPNTLFLHEITKPPHVKLTNKRHKQYAAKTHTNKEKKTNKKVQFAAPEV